MYDDGIGTLTATAVLIYVPSAVLRCDPSRIDVLIHIPTGSGGPDGRAIRTDVSDLLLTLYADDGSAEHGPGHQLSIPWSLANQRTAFPTGRAVWVEIDVSAANWPGLTPSTYYWLVLAPGHPLPLVSAGAESPGATCSAYNGITWTGVGSTLLPSSAMGDPAAFTARELVSQRFSGDAVFGAGTLAAVDFIAAATNWATVDSSGTRYLNWYASPVCPTRYGVQVLCWNVLRSL
jgi:hypothetical protein